MSNRQLDRWTNWARALTERHERVMTRRDLLVMTLLEPLRMAVSISQRRQNFSLSVFPRIRISIEPILQQLGREEFQSLYQNSSLTAVGNYQTWRSESRPARFVSFIYNTNQTATVSNSATQNFLESNSVTNQRHELTELLHSPVARLFARTQRRYHAVTWLKKLLVQNESQTIAERVVQEYTRVEHHRHRELVIRKQSAPAAVTQVQQSALEQQFAPERAHTRFWPEKPPEINVEQLTEQVIRKIDNRITAYRERLGRSF